MEDIEADTDAAKREEVDDDELFGLTDSTPVFLKLKVLLSQSLPVVLSYFIMMGGNFINLIFAGHYKDESVEKNGDNSGDSTIFAGVSLCNMFISVSYLSIMIGMTSAIETLGSQHNGAGHYKEVGFVFQRSCCVLTVLTLPILVVWYFSYDIFVAIGVQPQVCEVIRNFLRVRALTVPLDVLNESYKKYLVTMGVVKPGLISSISFNVLVLAFDLLFVDYFHMHYTCLAYSWVLSVYISAIIQFVISLQYEEVRRTLQPFNFQHAFSHWYEFFELGVPGTVMLCSEWWAYEILTVFASMLGIEQVAAEAIILQIASLAFMIPLGIAVACSSIVGNALGAGKVSLASAIGKLSMGTIVCFEIIVGITIYFLGPAFVRLFTEDMKVVDIVDSVIPFLSIFAMLDGLQGVGSGVFRGAGKQGIGAVANVIAFYVIGLPMAWVVCFKWHFGVAGLIMGLSLGTVLQVVVLLLGIFVFEHYLFTTVDIQEEDVVRNSQGFQKLMTEEDEDVWRNDDDADNEFVEIELNKLVAKK